MDARKYGISLRVFNLKSHSLARIKLNTRREIAYLRAPMHYTLFVMLCCNLREIKFSIISHYLLSSFPEVVK